MCNWLKSGNQRVDPCLRTKIDEMQEIGYDTLACCCGHGKYTETVVYRDVDGTIYATFNNGFLNASITILRKKRFYVRDSEGVFYIPEVEMFRWRTQHSEN